MKKNILVWALSILTGLLGNDAYCQIFNAYGRDNQSLNGEWHAIVDPFDRGRSMGIYNELNGDPVPDILDVVGVNKYIGWYNDWPAEPSDVEWFVAADKPLIFSEFGGEALYGNHGNEDAKWSWSEDFQAKLYSDNIKMFENIPNLAGVCPWVLFDFRSPTRFSPQQGLEFNRKGLVSDKGLRKKAWYVMQDYYNSKKQSSH